jgi:hypothetical protein
MLEEAIANSARKLVAQAIANIMSLLQNWKELFQI